MQIKEEKAGEGGILSDYSTSPTLLKEREQGEVRRISVLFFLERFIQIGVSSQTKVTYWEFQGVCARISFMLHYWLNLSLYKRSSGFVLPHEYR